MHVCYIDKVDSTQNLIKEYLNEQPYPKGIAVYSFNQYQGYGQGTHSWDCQPNQGIALSIAWPVHKNPDWILLNQHISVGITQYLQTCTQHTISLKWPNDIVCQHKKLGGIIMQTANYHETSYLIVGVGINIRSVSEHTNRIALDQLTTDYLSLETICQGLICHLDYQWNPPDIQRATDLYAQILWGKSEHINVLFSRPPSEIKSCLFMGVDQAGRAIFNIDGSVQHFHHGEARIVLPPS